MKTYLREHWMGLKRHIVWRLLGRCKSGPGLHVRGFDCYEWEHVNWQWIESALIVAKTPRPTNRPENIGPELWREWGYETTC